MTVPELHQLLEPMFDAERDMFFGSRNSGLLDTSLSSAKGQEEIPPEIHAITKMGLSEYEAYIEILLYLN